MGILNDKQLYYALVDIDGTIKDLVKESTNALEKTMQYMGNVNLTNRGKFVLWLNKISMYIVKLGILPTNKFMQNILMSAYSLILFKNPKIFTTRYFEEYNKEEVFLGDTNKIIEKLYNKDLVVCMLSKNNQNKNILEKNQQSAETKNFAKYVATVCIANNNIIKYFLYKSFMKKRNIYDVEVVIIGDNFFDDVLPAMFLGTKVVWCNKYNSKLKQKLIFFLKFFTKKVLEENEIKDI